MDGSLAQILLACTEGRLDEVQVDMLLGMCATVILASPGYPGSYPKGLPISGLEQEAADVMVFHAGTAVRDGQVVTAGGRVLAVTGYGSDRETALNRAYGHIEHLHFEGMQYRRDIGRVEYGHGVLS
jgi:phosphoribosylamine--glycine ligase